MTFTNYWWLLIWMFTGGFVLAKAFPKRYEYVLGKKEIRWNIVPAVIMVIPYIVWAGIRGDSFGDTAAYRSNFWSMPTSIFKMSTYLSSIKKDKGFTIFSIFIKSIIGNHVVVYFIILAAIQMLIMALIYRKYSCNYWMSIFIFIASTDYMSFAQNGLRQFTAVTILMAALPFLLKKKYVPLILMILLATTMHASALIMLPVVFIVQGKPWNKRTILIIVLAVLVLIYVDQFTDILDQLLTNTQYSNMVTDWTEWQDDGTNPIRVLIYSLPMLLSLCAFKWIKAANDKLINITVNFSIITTAVAIISMVTSGIFIGRLIVYGSVYSSSILLPWEIEHIFNKRSATVINGLMVVGYIALFYYQMKISWNLL